MIPFGKIPSEQEEVESSSLSSVISPRTKDVISRNVAQLIAQNVFKVKELEQKKQNINTDKEIEVVGHREGTIMRGAVHAVKDLVIKHAGRMKCVALFHYDDYMERLIKKAKILQKRDCRLYFLEFLII